MRLQYLCILLFLLTPAIIGTSCTAVERESPMSSDMLERSVRATNLTTCEPILIENDLDFILQGWPGSGIENDPFRLESLVISTDLVCVNISNTQVHFLIRNCLFQSNLSTHSGFAVCITNSSFARVVQCSVVQIGTGLRLVDCRDLTIHDTTVSCYWDGIHVISSSRVQIWNVSIVGADAISSGVKFSDSTSCRVTSSLFQDLGSAIICWESTECIIESNTVKEGLSGVYLYRTWNSSVTYNTIILNHSGIRLGWYSHDNTLYGNTIARNVHNAEDDGFSNEWDNGAGVGNTWGDYLGLGIYPIPGDAQGVDRYPLIYPSTIQLILVACGGMTMIVIIALLLLRRARTSSAIYIISVLFLVFKFIIPPIENLEQSLPIIELIIVGLDTVLVAIASWTLRISGLIYTKRVGIVDWSFAAASVLSFMLVKLAIGNQQTAIPSLDPSLLFLTLFSMASFLSALIAVHTSRDRKSSIRETLDWYYQSGHDKLEGNWMKKVRGYYDAEKRTKPHYVVAGFLMITAPIFGFSLGGFSFVLDEVGALSVCIFSAVAAKDLYTRSRRRVLILPVEEAALFVGLKEGMIIPNLIDVAVVFFSSLFLNGLLTMSDVPLLWNLLWGMDAVVLICFSLINLFQARNITDQGSLVHRGSSVAVFSLGCMYGLAYLCCPWMEYVWLFDTYMGLSSPVLVLWVLLLITTAAFSIKNVETPIIRFTLRPAFFLFYSFVPYISIAVENGFPSIGLSLGAGAIAVGLAMIGLRASYPMNAVVFGAFAGLASLILASTGNPILPFFVFISGAFAAASLIYRSSWERLGRRVMRDPDFKAALMTLLSGPMALNLFVERTGLDSDRAKEVLIALKSSGLVAAFGRGEKSQFAISSGYHRKRIAVAGKEQMT